MTDIAMGNGPLPAPQRGPAIATPRDAAYGVHGHGAPRLLFAMLTHDARAATARCLHSLARTTPVGFHVFVVDNASTDGTPQWLASRREPWLHVRANPTNRGVPGGRNDLLDFVLPQARDGDWLVFVDNDLEFEEGWLEPFLAAMRAHPAARVLGKVGHYVRVQGERRFLAPAPATTAHVDVVSGGFACFVRADAARRIGRFDEQLGLFWHEDDDYCVRALQAGLDVVAVPEARIVHHEHASGVAVPGLAEGGSRRNQAYLAQKWRAQGWLDRDGWIRRERGPYLPPHVRDELQRRARRRTPLGRSELGTALDLLERLVEQPDPRAWLLRRERSLPSCIRTLLELHVEQARAMGAHDVAARLEAAACAVDEACMAARVRPRVRVLGEVAGPQVGQGVCRASDFDDPELQAIADEMELGEIARDPWARDRVLWEELAAALALRRECVAGTGCRVLLPHGRLPHLHAWLERAGVAVATCKPGQAPAAGPFAALVVDRPPDCETVTALLAAAGPDTLVVLVGDVALNAVPTPEVGQVHQLDLDLLERTRLVPVAPLNRAVEAAVLEACARPDDGDDVRPQLARRIGPQVVTSFAVAARCAARPASPPAAAALPDVRVTPRAAIGVDLRTLFFDESAARGIGHYTLRHLAAVAEQAPDIELIGYVARTRDRLPALLQRANVRTMPIDSFAPGDVGLVHVPDPMNLSTGFDSPLRVLRHRRTTVTFHDLTPLHLYLEHWPRRIAESYRDRLHQLERSEAHLLTNSAFTAHDVVAHTAIGRDRVTPILAGLNGAGRRQPPPPDRIAAVLDELGVRGPFLLHVGAHDPHKNFMRVLGAFLAVRAKRPLQLVVAGAVDLGMTRAAAYCQQRGIPDVTFTGYLPREHLDCLYAAATALVSLSQAEGFGFPLLEAMAAGCPVVASGVTSHPEVAGDAGLLVDPERLDQAAAAIERLLIEPELAGELRTRGWRQAERFTWQGVASRTLGVWRAMLAGQPVPAEEVEFGGGLGDGFGDGARGCTLPSARSAGRTASFADVP